MSVQPPDGTPPRRGFLRGALFGSPARPASLQEQQMQVWLASYRYHACQQRHARGSSTPRASAGCHGRFSMFLRFAVVLTGWRGG